MILPLLKSSTTTRKEEGPELPSFYSWRTAERRWWENTPALPSRRPPQSPGSSGECSSPTKRPSTKQSWQKWIKPTKKEMPKIDSLWVMAWSSENLALKMRNNRKKMAIRMSMLNKMQDKILHIFTKVGNKRQSMPKEWPHLCMSNQRFMMKLPSKNQIYKTF